MPHLLFPPRKLPAEGEVDLRPALSAFGRYDLLEKLGESRDHERFVARSDGFEGLFRLVALKRLKAARCSDVVLVSRFIEEARLAVRVEHPGTVSVDDFGRVGGVYFIADQLVDGISLAELLGNLAVRGLRLDPRAAASIARDVGRAIHAAHQTRGADGQPLGIAHGNLCPSNVLVGRDGRVKIKGFAAPSLFRQEGGVEALGVRDLAYAAPELFDEAEPTARTDLWSIGVLLAELLTGRSLFRGDTLAEVAAAVRTVPLAPPSARVGGVPALLDAVVDEALQRAPGRRPEGLEAWLGGLDDALLGYGPRDFRAALQSLDDDITAPVEEQRAPTRVSRVGRAPAPVELGDGQDERSAGERGGARGGAESAIPDAVVRMLAKDRGLWGLVRLGERAYSEGRADEAIPMLRSAAVLFASRGLLAHALCAYDGARRLLSTEDATVDVTRFVELCGGDEALRQRELRRVGGLAYQEVLRAQTDGGLERVQAIATPFLSALPPEPFARLALAARVLRVQPGAAVLREGEPGDSLFAVGEGRLVVTCTPSRIDSDEGDVEANEFEERTDPGGDARRVGAVVVSSGLRSELNRSLDDANETFSLVDPRQTRVFLSALTAGDLFGEFSFLTGRPRSASVEAVTACRLVEISRSAVGSALDDIPALRDALESFYKERVLEWMLAKNEVFSLLEPAARRQLLSQCGVYDIPARKVVVREGELHDAMYFIKKGEVEVTLDDHGVQVFINKLGPGEFFGEIAALEGGPRRASVRAVTDLEVFRIARSDLQPILDAAPEVKARLAEATRARSLELKRRIAEQRRVLAAT